jgi:hypothetical protein
MQVTKRLLVTVVAFNPPTGGLQTTVQEQLIDENGAIVSRGVLHGIQAPQNDEKIHVVVEAMKPEIERIIREAQTIDKPSEPAMPEIPAIVRGGTEVRAAVPATEGIDATYKPLFAPDVEIVFAE